MFKPPYKTFISASNYNNLFLKNNNVKSCFNKILIKINNVILLFASAMQKIYIVPPARLTSTPRYTIQFQCSVLLKYPEIQNHLLWFPHPAPEPYPEHRLSVRSRPLFHWLPGKNRQQQQHLPFSRLVSNENHS